MKWILLDINSIIKWANLFDYVLIKNDENIHTSLE